MTRCKANRFGWHKTLAWPLLAISAFFFFSCARDSSHQAAGCESHDDCNPGYICSPDGVCVSGAADAGGLDAMIFPPSDALAPDGSVCAEAHFPLSETEEAFVVPANARYMHVKLWGAGGNAELGCAYYNNGGIGGYSEAVFNVTPGDELIVIVGRRGQTWNPTEEPMRFGFGHWGGGGLSGVFHGPGPITEDDAEEALIIAGGGGSAGPPPHSAYCAPGGSGNHPDAGGMPTMLGGEGFNDINGGGGGYTGGLGGTDGYEGGGGEGFVDAVLAVDGRTRLEYSEPGDNPPPNTDDEDYDGEAGLTEKNGLVVVRFVCTMPPPL